MTFLLDNPGAMWLVTLGAFYAVCGAVDWAATRMEERERGRRGFEVEAQNDGYKVE